MKNLLLAIMIILISFNARGNDSQQVLSVWGFAVGSNQGVFFRKILENANREQFKYFFVFENKPGAGGAISAKYVLDQKKPAILAHSAAFFARPFLYADTPYNFNDFRPLMIMGFSPAALVSKEKSLEQILSSPKINFSTSGTGSTTHLFAEIFAKKYLDKDIKMIHYSNSNEAYTAVLGGHADLTFEFLGDAKSKGNTRILGITGNTSIDNLPLLKNTISADYKDAVGIFVIYVKKDISQTIFDELQSILLKAEQNRDVQDLYKRDSTTKDLRFFKPGDYNDWYEATKNAFKNLTNGIILQ